MGKGLELKKGILSEKLFCLVRMHFTLAYHQVMGVGIHPGQIPLIRVLNTHDGISQKELSDLLHIKPSTANVSVRRMENGGFVEKRPDPLDHRITRIYKTEKLCILQEQIQRIWEENEKRMTDGFSQEEMVQLGGFLDRMYDNLRNGENRENR